MNVLQGMVSIVLRAGHASKQVKCRVISVQSFHGFNPRPTDVCRS